MAADKKGGGAPGKDATQSASQPASLSEQLQQAVAELVPSQEHGALAGVAQALTDLKAKAKSAAQHVKNRDHAAVLDAINKL